MTSDMKWIVVGGACGVVLLVVGLVINRLQPREFRVVQSWRKAPFKVGSRYRVLRSFQALRDAFSAGEILVYKSEGYSRYDGATGYFFEAPDDPRTRAWDVGDDEDAAVWNTLFEEVPPK